MSRFNAVSFELIELLIELKKRYVGGGTFAGRLDPSQNFTPKNKRNFTQYHQLSTLLLLYDIIPQYRKYNNNKINYTKSNETN